MTGKAPKGTRKSKKKPGLPSKEALLKYMSEYPEASGKRELARAFGLKGQQKISLKAMLKELAVEGKINRRGKRFSQPGTLPSVTVYDISTRDREGGLLAHPVQWDESIDGKRPIVSVVQDTRKKGPTPGVGDRILARIARSEDKSAQRVRVLKILDRQRGAVLGVYRKLDEPLNGFIGRIEPVDRKQDELQVQEGFEGDAKPGDLVEVSESKSGRYGLKQARVEKIIGDLTSEKAVSLIALHQHNIPTDFPSQVLSETEQLSPVDMDSREDWRDVPLITIDPADAKDHDDAIYAHLDDDPKNPGGHIVIVAIADVSWYVRPSTNLDLEALKRGNSVYFPDRVVPMLPERISNDLCSLKEKIDRPALAVKMTFDQFGHKVRHQFHRIMMHSHARLAYQEAQAAIDGEEAPRAEPLLKEVLQPLWAAYATLRSARIERQPLELDMPERKILLTADGKVDRVIVPPRLDAHKLVEEFMIQANVAAAETLEKKKQKLIYRVHDSPSLAKLESLRQFLKSLNIPLARAGQLRPAHFNQILQAAMGNDNEELINQVVLRSQSQAEYSPANIGHFGLNLAKYAHFTSPIRRYADLVVHRALIGSLSLGAGAITKGEEDTLDGTSEEISQAERRAMLAERQTIDRLIAGHLADKIGAEFDARINGVTRSGLFVTSAETGADGFIPISRLGDEYFVFDEVSHQVIGEHSSTVFQMGDKVSVRLVEAAPVAGALRFEMISEGRVESGLPRTKRGRPGSPSGRPRRSARSNRYGGSKRNN